jgi:dolichol-phosphate mannosyltransferase
VLFRCRKGGCRIGETPIIFENRRAGASKVNPKEVVRSISILIWIGIHAFLSWE